MNPRERRNSRPLVRWLFGLAFVIAAPPAIVAEEMHVEVNDVGVSLDRANIALFNSPITTYRDQIYIAFVRPQTSGDGYETVVGQYDDGEWDFSVVEPNTRDDPYHTQPSLAVDGDGYIHVTYNMHSLPWQYAVSSQPEQIADWTFSGQPLAGPHDEPESSYVSGPGTAAIPGDRITYQFLTTDRRGNLYAAYREALKTAPGTDCFRMQWSLGIARYDVASRTWSRVGPEGFDLPFASEPGFRAQGARVFFDPKGRMHVSWTWYAEYEQDGSGHFKPNYPSYAYSDDGGRTFSTAGGKPLKLPVRFEDSDRILDPSWLEPNDGGHFSGYTELWATATHTPYVWVMPKAPPPGKGRAIIRYDMADGWSTPLLMPWGATRFFIDRNGVLTAVSSGLRVDRSRDSGATWTNHEIDAEDGSFHHWLDYA